MTRSIGGGRFEALYKEVLPILEEMLETLNYLLAHSEPGKKDLFVELCLTVPVRLTNLLPHLGYLMKPLVHALNAGSDLVSQGLRTLELCIDNLTSEFLDPTMGPVFRDLMSALYNLLQPLPFNHQHSHSAVKILGKLGGRNRRFQQRPYLLDYRPIEENISISLTFENRRERLAAAGWIDTAARAVSHSRSHYRLEAIKLLKQTSNLFLQNVGQQTSASIVRELTFPNREISACSRWARSQSSSATSRRCMQLCRTKTLRPMSRSIFGHTRKLCSKPS